MIIEIFKKLMNFKKYLKQQNENKTFFILIF